MLNCHFEKLLIFYILIYMSSFLITLVYELFKNKTSMCIIHYSCSYEKRNIPDDFRTCKFSRYCLK